MPTNPKVDEFLTKQSQWQPELSRLRELALASGLQEDFKWRAPVYTENGKNVAGIAGFKEFVSIWFFQGALLKDEAAVLVNAQEGKTQALRQWRFSSLQEIEKYTTQIAAYLAEAKANQKSGKSVPVRRQIKVPDCEELQACLTADPETDSGWQKLTPGRQREYAEYILEAKQETTKQRRLQKIIPMIRTGRGLQDAYRKC